MQNINEILALGKTITPERQRIIEEQLARRDTVRAQRQASREKAARRTALELFPHIQQLGTGMSNPDNVAEASLAYHVIHGRPIPFVGFWGVGEKSEIDSLDAEYIDRLDAKRDHVAAHYQHGAQMTIILANIHGVFNGHVPDNLQSLYLDQIDEALHLRDIHTVWLNQLYHNYGLEMPGSVDLNDPNNEAYWVFRKHRDKYMRSALRHHMTEAEARVAGFKYVQMRLQERPMLEEEFPDSLIMVNGTKMTAEPLMPKTMPVIYLPEGPVWFRQGAPLR